MAAVKKIVIYEFSSDFYTWINLHNNDKIYINSVAGRREVLVDVRRIKKLREYNDRLIDAKNIILQHTILYYRIRSYVLRRSRRPIIL